MPNPKFSKAVLCAIACLMASACGSNDGTKATGTEETAPKPAATASFPASLSAFGDGYPDSGDACRRLGESEATADWLDDSADLVGCPTEADAKALGGRIVGNVEGIIIASVPTSGAGEAMESPVPAAEKPTPKDIVRGKGGLEEKCLQKVAAQGTRVIGTNRIEESEAAIEIYVNVEGGNAPWRCLAYRNGTIGDVEFTGDEGQL